MSYLAQAADQLKIWMDAHREELVSFTMDLMRINSVTYHEAEAVAFLASAMKRYGFDEVRIDEAGNCIGRVGSGPTVIVSDAHIDTVECGDPQKWGFNPLDPKIVDDAIMGRGIVDDKGCLCAMVFAARAIKELKLDQDLTYWVSGSISEEDVEGSCVKAMMEQYKDIAPDMIIIGEASGNRIVRGHKGRALIKMTVQGKAAHASSAHRGENALIKALPLIQAIDDMQNFIEDPFLGKGTIEVTKVECDTPSLNTIPGSVTIFADRRLSCGETKNDILEELTPLLALSNATACIDVEEVTTYTGKKIIQEDYFPSWVIDENHPVIRSAVSAYTQLYKKDPVVGRWDFCTNATYLCGITKIPCVGFGPGDETLCHTSAEALSISELCDAVSMYALTTLAFAESNKEE
jgi:putative selenium metabolism hydrolase